MNSLQRLQAPKLDGFLLHRPSDLLKPDGEASLYWLDGLRDRGLVDRIGVSIYDASDLEGSPMDHLQLVQLPLSVYDQRLIRDGTVGRLLDLGIAVHVRSVLLQGLLVQPIKYWPDYLSQSFRDHHKSWLDHLDQLGLSPMAGALGFVRAVEGIEAILVGVLSENELKEVLQVWSHTSYISMESNSDWFWEKSNDIDPRLWP